MSYTPTCSSTRTRCCKNQVRTADFLYRIAKELEHDIFKAIGEHNVAWHVIEGGHEFPITRAEDVVREISTVWGI